ncbi:hypothetical protein [Kordiimonas aestuarii]|uniref:hypothetical protein n=1 Tax=Kordiimonas aestuarii TaxID=1005925 RepID=UPI0021D2DBF3|nr:hypothetical protein [Kordiimonas aestuarii]
MIRIVFLVVVALALSQPARPDADAPATIPLEKLFSGYDEYLEKSAERMLIIMPVYTLSAKLAKPEDVDLEFFYEGNRISFRPQSDGRLRYRPSAAMLEANPEVQTNQPRGTLAMTITIDVVMVARNRYAMEELHDRVHKAWGQAKSSRGIMSIFASKHSGLRVHFPASCTERKWMVTRRGGVVASGADAEAFTLDFGKKEIRKADQLLLSCRPDRFTLN